MIIFYLMMYLLRGFCTGIFSELVIVPKLGRNTKVIHYILFWPALYLGMLVGMVELIVETIKRE